MSLSVEGIPALQVLFEPVAVTRVSVSFYQRLAHVRGPRLPFTTIVPGFPPFSSVVDCAIGLINVDVVLGLDWASHIREILIHSGFRIDRSFDAWTFFHHADHPIRDVRLTQVHAHGAASTPVAIDGALTGLHPVHSETYSETYSETLNSRIPHVPIVTLNEHSSHPGVLSPDSNPDAPRPVARLHTARNPGRVPESHRFVNFEPPPTPASSSSKPPDVKVSVERRGFDALDRLLLSPDPSLNLFTMNTASLTKLLLMHHVELPDGYTLLEAQQALISHFLAGSCAAITCGQSDGDKHTCHCRQFSAVYPSTRSMIHAVLSLFISASEDRFPENRVEIVACCLGFVDRTRLHFNLQLARKRERLVVDQTAAHSIRNVFENLGSLPKSSLLVIAQSHGLRLPKNASVFDMRTAIVKHVATGACTSREGNLSFIACSSVESQLGQDFAQPGTAEDPATRMQIHLIQQIAPVLKLNPLRRLLDLHDVVYKTSDGCKDLRRHLKKFLRQLNRGKCNNVTLTGTARQARAREQTRLRAEWPQIVPDHLKRKLLANFRFDISSESLSTFVCGSCTENCPMDQKRTILFEEFDLNLLKRPDECFDANSNDADSSDDDMDVDSNSDAARPWLDPRCPPPIMPMPQHSPYSSLLVDPSSLESDDETQEPCLAVCRLCKIALKKGHVPALSGTNRTYLGPVPAELQNLTVVEEAMIALCRAKCWIIQLREDDGDTSIPIAQRGVRGHIIVYPQRPSAIAQTLPPPIEDIVTPICVVFVGSQPPTAEWLREKATPLVVRKERVQNALAWLKVHNHLYRDVAIDTAALDQIPDESILPFHVQHIIPNDGIDVTTSDYIPGSSQPPPQPATPTVPNLSEILNPPSSSIPFQSVVVADVDGNAPSNELRSAALAHMKKPGSNYIELPHDPNPTNEFNNPSLFPMMYPTLFPYGIGGPEDRDRPTRLSFKRHIKHFFNLADRRFQEHYSFMFVAFNMLQRRALLLRTSFKVKRSNFDHVAAQFGTVSPKTVHIVSERVAAGDRLTANNAEERRVLRLGLEKMPRLPRTAAALPRR